jgi:hypothetical protein
MMGIAVKNRFYWSSLQRIRQQRGYGQRIDIKRFTGVLDAFLKD